MSEPLISHWTIWTDCKQERSSIGRLQKVGDLVGRALTAHEIVAHPKTGGHRVCFRIALEATGWNDAVVECIDLGQRTAHGWTLTGSVLDDACASSTATSVSGVVMVAWQLLQAGPRSPP